MFAGSNPGSAMLLHVSDELSGKGKYAGGLSRSGASPYQRNIEDDDEYEDDFCGAVDVSARSATSPLASKTPELGRTSRSRQRS
jgi:hypothetical protein